MTEKSRVEEVYLQVSAEIDDQDARELWIKLRSELTRQGGGPDACLAYLEDELTRMEEQVKRALEWIEEPRGG